jgi:hypothetical protein
MAYADEENLPVQLIHTANRTLRNVRRQWQRIGSDLVCRRTGCGKGEGMRASDYARQTPKCIGYDSKVCCCRRSRGIERCVTVSSPRRHDQSAVRAERITKCLNEAKRAAFDWPGGAKRRVHEEDTALVHSEGTELSHYFRFAELASTAPVLSDAHFQLVRRRHA